MLTVIIILILLNVALYAAKATVSGAGTSSPLRVALAPEKCADARHGLRYYQRRYNEWRERMGARVSSVRPVHGSCSRVRYLAKVWRDKAGAARRAYLRWWHHEFAWWEWMPDKFQRVGACETGYGKRPGRFDWDSGLYVSFAGIYRPAYEAYHRWTGHNSPREQYEVAAAIQARYGWGAWGCGGA